MSEHEWIGDMADESGYPEEWAVGQCDSVHPEYPSLRCELEPGHPGNHRHGDDRWATTEIVITSDLLAATGRTDQP